MKDVLKFAHRISTACEAEDFKPIEVIVRDFDDWYSMKAAIAPHLVVLGALNSERTMEINGIRFVFERRGDSIQDIKEKIQQQLARLP